MLGKMVEDSKNHNRSENCNSFKHICDSNFVMCNSFIANDKMSEMYIVKTENILRLGASRFN